MSARHPWISRWAGPTRDDQDIVVESLSQMGLEALMHRDVGSLSGGERRRVELAARLNDSNDVRRRTHLDTGRDKALDARGQFEVRR